MTSDKYTLYYIQQAEERGLGGGYKNIRVQKGEGIGSFLSVIFRQVLPLFKSGAKAVGKQAWELGLHLLRDTISGRNLKESLKDRVHQAGSNLTNKAVSKIDGMVGLGYNKSRRVKGRQSRKRVTKRQVRGRKISRKSTNRKRKRKTALRSIPNKKFKDIFQ